MAKGRSKEQKATLIREFTDSMVKTIGVDPSAITIMIDELDKENIGKAGTPLSELK